jgi:thiol-disulfide isomerase/thioredoxin
MELIILVARLLLALVFGLAGTSKLVDRAGSRQAMHDFGVPRGLARPLGALLPLAELGLAISLLLPTTAWWGAVGAASLLLVFEVMIGVNLARGRKLDCHCFGQIAAGPAGWWPLVRNGLLVATAGLVIANGSDAVAAGQSAVSWLTEIPVTAGVGFVLQLGILVIVAGQAWLLMQLISQNGRLLIRLDALEGQVGIGGAPTPTPAAAPAQAGLPIGAVAPSFTLNGLYGETLTLDALRAANNPVLLTFMDSGCGPCQALMPEVAQWQHEYAGSTLLAIIKRGTPEAERAQSTQYNLSHVLLQQDREIADAYQAYGTPSMVLVRPNGTIGSAIAAGADAIRALVTQVTGTLQPLMLAPPSNGMHNTNGHDHTGHQHLQAAAKVGELAPQLQLPDLDGKTVDLADFRGNEVLVLFWNPGCGFCQQMLGDLKAWEAKPPIGTPNLMVVSTGPVQENRAMGLSSPVLLEPSFAAGAGFGVSGTPSAVLVDSRGMIASEVAIGAEAVLSLMSGQRL